MSIQRLQSYYGFTRMPFGRGLAPAMLHRHPGHAEAVARISWCVDQHALGVITGEVGAGKTVAIRAATSALDPARHVVIYLPNPSVGVRGMLHHIVTALGRVPSFYTATLAPQAAEALAAEYAERGRTPVVVIDITDRRYIRTRRSSCVTSPTSRGCLPTTDRDVRHVRVEI
ncbi:AAA family ATPase, partial [Rhodococcus opacus]|uniref:AAA family ATPase n=1 Tax=Rhodococcus opacus TaxID=37919 RepID=UPI001F53FBB6